MKEAKGTYLLKRPPVQTVLPLVSSPLRQSGQNRLDWEGLVAHIHSPVLEFGTNQVSRDVSQIGGRLRWLLTNRAMLTPDPWILQTVRGCQVEFLGTPQQSHETA